MDISWVVRLADEVTGRVGVLLALEDLVVVVGGVATSVALGSYGSSKDDQVPTVSAHAQQGPITYSVILA